MTNNRESRKIEDAHLEEIKTISIGPDGVYRWAYDFNLYRNPTILFLIWKIFALIFVGIWLFVTLISIKNYRFWPDEFLSITKTFAFVILGMLVLCAVGYLVYAIMMGGKYHVLFEMGEKGITHTQIPKQFDQTQRLAMITAFVGIATGKPGVIGTGLLAGSKSSIYSDFKQVRKIKAYPKRCVIKLNSPFVKNQVYTRKEDFAFVLGFISGRCRRIKQ